MYVNGAESSTHLFTLGSSESRPDNFSNRHARVCYVGNPTAQWGEIKRVIERRYPTTLAECDVNELKNFSLLNSIDLILVGEDISLQPPHEICREIRQLGYYKPMLVITNTGDPIDAILGLECGADAWTGSDTDARAVVAQIRALLRRAEQALTPANIQDNALGTIAVGNLLLCARSHELLIGEQPFRLSGCEFSLLWILAKNAGKVVTPSDLQRPVGHVSKLSRSRTINTNIARLRKKLGVHHADRIKTIRSEGYMLCVEPLIHSRAIREN